MKRTITSSTPGDFPTRIFMLRGRRYEIVGCGSEPDRNGRRKFFQDVKNDRGEYKRYDHDELLKLIRDAGTECQFLPSKPALV